MNDTFTSQSVLLEQDRNQKRKRSNDSWQLEASDGKRTQCVLITQILVTDVIAGLHCSPAGVYATVDIDGITTKTSSNQPVFKIEAKDTVEWDQEIVLPSDRSSMISFKVYASFEIDQQTPGNDDLLCECETTVGELLDRNGQFQLLKNGGDPPSCFSLRVILERRVCDAGHDASGTSVSQQSLATIPEMTRGLLSQLLSKICPIKESDSGSLSTKAGPRIFALIVTVDKYKSKEHIDLIGCKYDGERLHKKILTDMLGVPSSQIVFLDDENATREAIIQKFHSHFINNEAIAKDDAMIFFFAGHGTRVDAPEGWVSEGNKLEGICPYDADTFGDDGKTIYAIYDRTISGLVRRLAIAKGNNITIILDCCHSGGATRSDEPSSLRVRSSFGTPPPLNLDQEIWDFSTKTSSRGEQSKLYKAMETHVLLAACRSGEVASGDASGGLFTSALVKALERSTFHDTTYSRLFDKLHIKNDSGSPQHPQCLGWNKDRLLFSTSKVNRKETTFGVSQREHRTFVSAGRIHGVVKGTEFTLKSCFQTMTSKAVEVDAFECLLEPHHPNFIPESAVVLDWNHPTLKVHSSIHQSGIHFTVVPPNEQADISIRQNGLEWEFERHDPLMLKYAPSRMTIEAEKRAILEAPPLIGNFMSYLYRSERASFAEEIKVKLQRAEKRENVVGPTGEDLLEVSSLLIEGMEVKQATVTNLDIEYCLTIENFSEVGLFPYLFYFEPSDYSIQPWYLPPSFNMPPPLQPRKNDGSPGKFAYGYGGFGTDPIEFYLPEGRTIDSGFLKIFLTNAYADLSGVAQSAISQMRIEVPPKSLRHGIWECRTFVLTCKTP